MVGEAACEERENSVEAGNWRRRARTQHQPSVLLGDADGLGLLTARSLCDAGWNEFGDILVRLRMTPEQRLPSGWLKKEGGCAKTQVNENMVGQRQQVRDQGPWTHPVSRP